jgi:hypothetical protein
MLYFVYEKNFMPRAHFVSNLAFNRPVRLLNVDRACLRLRQ